MRDKRITVTNGQRVLCEGDVHMKASGTSDLYTLCGLTKLDGGFSSARGAVDCWACIEEASHILKNAKIYAGINNEE